MGSFVEHLEERCSCLEFSPYKESSSLLALGGKSRVTVKTCQDSSSSGSFFDDLKLVTVFSLLCEGGGGVAHLSWSPDTHHTQDEGGRYVFSTTSHHTHTLTLYRSTPQHTTTEVLSGHSSAVNDLTFNPCDPTLLASVGDDRVCRVWDLNKGQLRSEFTLRSPGMAVKWHPREPATLLVGEKLGCVRVYDLTTEVPVLSLDTGAAPLMGVDWSPSNSLYVGGVANGNWFVWNTSQSSRPVECGGVSSGPSTHFSWCPQSEGVFSTLGAGNQLNVHHLGHQKIPISCSLPGVSDVSWHCRLPLLGAVGDRQLHLWLSEI